MTPARFAPLAYVLIVFGAVTAAGSTPVLAGPLNVMADLIFLPLDGYPQAEDPVFRLLASIAGGLMVGWGVMIWRLSRDASLASAIRWGGIAWYVVDSTGSVLSGVPINALYNLGFLALFIGVTWPRRAPSAS